MNRKNVILPSSVRTLYFNSISIGDVDTLKRLISEYPKALSSINGNRGNNGLFYSVKNNHIECSKVLLSHGLKLTRYELVNSISSKSVYSQYRFYIDNGYVNLTGVNEFDMTKALIDGFLEIDVRERKTTRLGDILQYHNHSNEIVDYIVTDYSRYTGNEFKALIVKTIKRNTNIDILLQ